MTALIKVKPITTMSALPAPNSSNARTIAWFGAFRRLVVRYERSTRMFLAFFQFAAVLIALRRL